MKENLLLLNISGIIPNTRYYDDHSGTHGPVKKTLVDASSYSLFIYAKVAIILHMMVTIPIYFLIHSHIIYAILFF